MEIRQQILDNVLEICDGDKILEKKLSISFATSKYSSVKKDMWHVNLNDKMLSRKRNNNYTVKYKCVTCNNINVIGMITFLRKINKGSIECTACRNFNEEKRKKQSIFLKKFLEEKKNNIDKEPKEEIIIIKTNKDLKKESEVAFNLENDEYKTSYFLYHLNQEDYTRISKNLISFHNGRYNNLSELEFWPVFKTNNQMNYTSVLYDKVNDSIIKAHQPILKCENCDNEWRAKSIEKFKNSIKIMCKDCSFTNKIFKIRKTTNCNNDNIMYQSKLELKFIKWCNKHKIVLKNGPNVKYVFKEKERTYRVDFCINKTLIEIKDNHIWHQNDIKTGKWKAKEDSVYKLINEGLYDKYYLMTPQSWKKYKTKIINMTKQDIV